MRGPGVAAVVVVLVGCDPGGLPAGVELPTAAARPELAAVGMLGERCGATAIDVGGGADAPAYALTAGHCTGMSAANQPHVIDLAPAALGTIHFGLFTDTRAQPRDVGIAERLYESMLGTDLALVRLDATVGALRARGITPIALAAAPPPAGAPISIASFPSITADDPDRVLHLSRCDQGGTVRLIDLTEWDPPLDPSDLSALVAARWVAECLAGYEQR